MLKPIYLSWGKEQKLIFQLSSKQSLRTAILLSVVGSFSGSDKIIVFQNKLLHSKDNELIQSLTSGMIWSEEQRFSPSLRKFPRAISFEVNVFSLFQSKLEMNTIFSGTNDLPAIDSNLDTEQRGRWYFKFSESWW